MRDKRLEKLKTCNLLIDCIHVQVEYPFFRLQYQHSASSSFRKHLEFFAATMFALHLYQWCMVHCLSSITTWIWSAVSLSQKKLQAYI